MAASAVLYLALLLHANLRADPPKVATPDRVTGVVCEFITVKAATDGPSVKFVAIDPGLNVFPSELLANPKVTVVSACKAGTYRLMCYTGNEHGPSDPTTTLVVVVDPVPPVPPTPVPPDPGPTPPGPVTPSALFVVVVEETAQAAATRGAFFTDPALSARLKDKGHKPRVVDKDVKNAAGQTPPDVKPYIDRAAGKTLPVMYLVDPTGKVRYEGVVPKTSAEFISLLESVGG